MEAKQRIDRSRQLQEQLNRANEELEALEPRLSECRHRLTTLCKVGPLPADEALAAFDRSLDRLVEEGRLELSRKLEDFTRPQHHNPAALSNPFRAAPDMSDIFRHPQMSDYPTDSHPVFVYLQQAAIREEGRAAIKAACADSELPPEQRRVEEIDKLGKEVEQLKAKRSELQDKISRLLTELRSLLDTKQRPAGTYAGGDAA